MDWDPLEAPPSNPDAIVGKGLMPLWNNEAFADYKDFTILVGGEELKVHKLIMIAASHYFKALLESDMVERNANKVELKGLSSLAVSNIIELIYTNKITGKRASSEDLLECAAYLQIPPAIEMASRFLKDEIDEKNCFDILHIFESYSCKCEIEYTKEFIKSNLDGILKLHDLEKMSHEDFCQVVELWVKPEWEIFEAIQKWIAVNPDTRKPHANDLYSRVRFCLMTRAELQTIVGMDIYAESNGSWRRLVHNAVNYLKLPAHKRILDDSEQSRVRANPLPVVVTALAPEKSYMLQNDGSWKSLETHSSPDLMQGGSGDKGAAAHIVVNNYLIVCGAYSNNQQWHIFDPRTVTWSPMAKLRMPRSEFALAHDGRYLYALGGCTDCVEKYDFETDTWCVMDTKLPICWRANLACQLSGSIYITGGFHGHSQFLRRLDCFNPSTETWESKAPMFEKRPSFAMNAIKLRGEEFILVMCDKFIMQYYNPRADQWSMWTSYSDIRSDLTTDNPCQYRYGTVLARNDTLYLLNYDRQVESQGEDDDAAVRDKPAGCKMWKLHAGSRYVKEEPLTQFPLFDEDEQIKDKYVAGLLSFLPKTAHHE